MIIHNEQPGTTTINVIAKAGLLPDKNDKEIENKMTVSALNYDETTTNTVKNVIEYYQSIHDQSVIHRNNVLVYFLAVQWC